MTRAWFRRRLAVDARRWVLLLAALGGLCAFALQLAQRAELLTPGPALAVLLGFAAIAPATGVLAMLAHGRLLWWTGKILGGRARPEEIHAACAWSELPFVIGAAPLVLAVPLRAAIVQLDPTPPGLQLARELLQGSAGALVAVAGMAAAAGALAYVAFLGEAQGFRWWRAVANHLLAMLAGLGLLGAGAATGVWAVPGRIGATHALTGVAAVAALALGIEAGARASCRRRDRREAEASLPEA